MYTSPLTVNASSCRGRSRGSIGATASGAWCTRICSPASATGRHEEFLPARAAVIAIARASRVAAASAARHCAELRRRLRRGGHARRQPGSILILSYIAGSTAHFVTLPGSGRLLPWVDASFRRSYMRISPLVRRAGIVMPARGEPGAVAAEKAVSLDAECRHRGGGLSGSPRP